MLRILFGALFLLLAAAGGAQAEGAASCQSILDRECEPLTGVTARGNLRVEVFVREGTAKYPMSPDDEDYAGSCEDGKCECDEDVQWLEFKGPVAGFAQVNAAEREASKKTACSAENANVMRHPMHYAVSRQTVSTAAFELEYCRTCGGSCHGATALATYNAKTGASYRLRDVVKPNSLVALQKHVVDAGLAAYLPKGQHSSERKILVPEIERRGAALLDQGVYVENGKAYVDLDYFLNGCADGSFYPIALPAQLIAPAFAALLKP